MCIVKSPVDAGLCAHWNVCIYGRSVGWAYQLEVRLVIHCLLFVIARLLILPPALSALKSCLVGIMFMADTIQGVLDYDLPPQLVTLVLCMQALYSLGFGNGIGLLHSLPLSITEYTQGGP